MEMGDIEIGLSGLGVGPFPDQDKVGGLIRQWRLLPLAKALGFSEEALTNYIVEFSGLFSGASINDFAKRFRNDFLPHWTDGLLMAPSLAERSTSPRDESPDAKNSDVQLISCVPCTDSDSQTEFPAPSKMLSKRNISLTNGWTVEEKAVHVLALFTALYAYLASVERAGLDVANSFSDKVHADVLFCPIEILLDLPGTFAGLQKQNPSQFTRLLQQYPDDDDDASIFEGATVFIPQEQKTIKFSDFVKGLREHSIAKPDRYYVIPVKKPEKARKRKKADLHDAGCYAESLMLSLLVGRDDFITRGVNLNVAQDEGLAIMDGSYAELGGEQAVAESLAHDYLDKQIQDITKASLLDGEAFHRVAEALQMLECLMTRFKKESTEELRKSEKLRKLGRPRSLDEEIEGEDGEITTLSESIQAPTDLEEALPQFLEIFKKLDPQDAELLKERFFEGKSLDEIAIERGWEYDHAQKYILHLVKDIFVKMS
jgi:hypothetical protein